MTGARALRAVWLVVALLLLAACQQHTAAPAVQFHAHDDPVDLAAWHVVTPHDGWLVPNQGVVPYTVNAKLFSDYAWKLRTVWMPKGTSAGFEAEGPFDFPVGTIISKTFYYPLPRGDGHPANAVLRTYVPQDNFVPGKGLKMSGVHLVETRLLLRREQGWHLITYVWNDSQTEAKLAPAGTIEDLVLVGENGGEQAFSYVVPSETQCQVCHNHVENPTVDTSPRYPVPIGPTARHLNRQFTYATGPANQLEHWASVGYLSGVPDVAKVPANAQWDDPSQPLAARARSYLDANCAYCHNPHGEANYTSLWLEAQQPLGINTGLCKTPVAAGHATGGHLFDVVPGKPDDSILPYRMASTRVSDMMPELGRTTYDRKGTQLIRAWIASLEGNCAIIHAR